MYNSLEEVKSVLNGRFEYSKIFYGELNKNQGDVVIVSLKENEKMRASFEETIRHFFDTAKIETKGIYTNIYFSPYHYQKVISNLYA